MNYLENVIEKFKTSIFIEYLLFFTHLLYYFTSAYVPLELLLPGDNQPLLWITNTVLIETCYPHIWQKLTHVIHKNNNHQMPCKQINLLVRQMNTFDKVQSLKVNKEILSSIRLEIWSGIFYLILTSECTTASYILRFVGNKYLTLNMKIFPHLNTLDNARMFLIYVLQRRLTFH